MANSKTNLLHFTIITQKKSADEHYKFEHYTALTVVDDSHQGMSDKVRNGCIQNGFLLRPVATLGTQPNSGIVSNSMFSSLNAVVYKVLQFSGCEVSKSVPFQARFTFRILQQYFTLSKSIYIHSSFLREDDVSMKMLLPCECFHQLFTSARSNLADPVYWNLAASFVNDAIQSSKRDSSTHDELHFKNIVETILFCWWWLLQQKLSDIAACQNLITRLLRMSISQCEDAELARVVQIYSRLNSTLDSTSIHTLNRFDVVWQFFARKISISSSRLNGDIQSYGYETFTPAEWTDHIDKLCRGTTSHYNTSSFAEFLAFFIGILKDSMTWGPVEEKFYSRLETMKAKNFDEGMWTKFFTIILILVKHGGDDAVIWNCCKTVLSTAAGVVEYQRKDVILSGLFSMVHYFVGNSRKFTALSEEIKTILTTVINDFTSADKSKAEQRHRCWKGLVSYIDNLHFVTQHSTDFSLGQANLVPSELLKKMLGNSRAHELSSFLLGFSHILGTLRSRGREFDASHAHNESFARFVAMFSAFLIGWLRKTPLASLQASPNFSQIVCDLACLTLTHVKDDRRLFEILWNKFGAECVELPVKTHSSYLVYFVTTSDISDALNEEFKTSNFCVKTNRKTPFCDIVVQGWFRCMLVSDLSDSMSTELQEFNRAFGALSVVRNVVEEEESEEVNFNNFLRCLSSKHKCSQNFLSRIRWSDAGIRWCFALVKVIVRQLAQQSSEVVYHNLSILMFHCSTLLYTAGKPSVVTEVLSHLTSITHNQRAVNCLQHCLHKFIFGVLPIAQTCVNIRRTLRTIITSYLKLYPCSGDSGRRNPFIKLMIEVGKSAHLNTCLSILYDSVADKQDDALITKFIEVLHKWLNQIGLNSNAEIEDVIAEKFQTFLQRFKRRCQLNVINSEKVDFLITLFRNLVEIQSSLDLFQD